MFNTNPNSKLSQIISIVEKLEKCKLEKTVLDQVQPQLKGIAEYLGVDEDSALFFSIIFFLQNQSFNSVNLHDIADFLDYSFIHILEFRNCLTNLENNNLIYLESQANSSPHSENNGYSINGTVMNNVIDGTPIAHFEKEADSTQSILDEILTIQATFSNRRMSDVEYKRQITTVEGKFPDNVMIKNLLEMFPEDFQSRLIIYNLSCEPVMGSEFSSDDREISEYSFFTVLPRTNKFKRRTDFREGTDILLKDKIVEKFYERQGSGLRGRTSVEYRLSNEGIKKIFGEEAANYITEATETTELDYTLSALREFGCAYEERKPLGMKRSILMDMERKNFDFKFFGKTKDLIDNSFHRFFLYDCLSDYLEGSDSNLSATLSDLYGKNEGFFTNLRAFLDEKHPLLRDGFLEINKNDIVDRTTISIGDRTLELLYGENSDIYRNNKTNKNIIKPSDLKEKELFYSKDVLKQIDMLTKSLDQKNLTDMQARLEKKGLAKGVAVLLYGAPGTGKTETVYQLAKKTNRQILHVDIADSKSMWFGESEKLIKKIFTNYRNLCKSCERHGENTPILLFNEADALISKRKDVTSGNVAQTENAIQNIILEEMEKLEGIMIATTNLCDNLDGAFERRFLFKVKYEKPALSERECIWKSKIDFLSDEDIKRIASAYDFSGGEIDNIVRKCEMNEIITGQKPSYEELTELCDNERLSKNNTSKIGFGF